MRIMAISGSLRAASTNTALLRAAQRLAPDGAGVHLFDGAEALPLFNPDIEAHPPTAVTRLWYDVAAADALLIASPEYAHGVTGTIKNLLDWLVGFEPFVGKPVAVLNASARSVHADRALRETLRTMSATLVHEASITVPLDGRAPDVDGIVGSDSASRRIVRALQALVRHVERSRG